MRLLISRVKGGSTVLPFAPDTGFQVVAGYPHSGSFAAMLFLHKQNPLPHSFWDWEEICLLCSKLLLPEIRTWEENHLIWKANLWFGRSEMSPGLHHYFLERATVFSEWNLVHAMFSFSFQAKADKKRREVSLPSTLLFSYHLFAVNAWWSWSAFFFLYRHTVITIFSGFVCTEK